MHLLVRKPVPTFREHARAFAVSAARSARMIRKLKGGKYRLYSRKVNPKTGRRRNLGTFASRKAAEQHEREVQYFKRY
jgi:cell division septation protein DedD